MRSSLTPRRRDLMRAGLAGGALGFAPGAARGQEARVALVVDPSDPVASAAPAQWALGRLEAALTRAGASVSRLARVEDARRGDFVIDCGAQSMGSAGAPGQPRTALDVDPERLTLMSVRMGGRRVTLARGSDARGLSYALSELADRVRHGAPVSEALTITQPIVERPLIPVRSVMRQFVSKPLDKAWFEDRAMWPAYLDMLAESRFNRFHLAFGLGYDALRGVTDSYLGFLYPFVVDVPGYAVSVTNFTAEERAANLDLIRFISEQSAARGIDFQLGIWTQAYALIDSPNANHEVIGLTPETHAAYCRDALTEVLRQCPAISAVAIRFHGESGIAEGNYDFWETVYSGAGRAGRVVEIDLHAKGINQEMIARAMRSGMPVNVSEKCWAEHHGMTYHQADIRPSERPREGQVGDGLMALSEGALSFTRYGYADLLREDRRYTVRHRVFAGTQRILLNGDPAWAAAYAKRFVFCGSNGFDLMEPLTARGRRGTGIPGTRRSGYVDASLEPRYDWEKYAYWYRVWGRLTYNPDSDPSVWRRAFGDGPAQSALASALARASRILQIVTTAHSPSAACDAFWPEICWNHSLVEEPARNLYWDTPEPKTFQYVTAHDPQLFAGVDEHARELLAGAWGAKYSPLEVAGWLEGLAIAVETDLAAAGAPASVEDRRLVIDARIQAGLGRYFASKLRAGVLFGLFEHSQDRRALEAAIARYREARDAWASLSETAHVYADDLSVSDKYSERTHWRAQVPSIDADIARLEERAASAAPGSDARITAAIAVADGEPPARRATLVHERPARFTPGAALPLEARPVRGANVSAVRCLYRHVNQAERWREVAMTLENGMYRAAIPADYTASPYPLQYYFVTADASGAMELSPGLGGELTDEPYFVVRSV